MTEHAAQPPRTTQLPLPLRQPEAEGLKRFIAEGNESLVAAVRHWTQGSGEPYLFVHGAAASGKSQLLLCAADEARRRGLHVIYLALDTDGLTPALLDELEHHDGVLLDALQARSGAPDWERALFNLYNRLRDSDRQLLVAARSPIGQLGIQLPDLASRLAAGATYNLKPLDDKGRRLLLRTGGKQRGLDLSDALINYILSRCPRHPGTLTLLLDRIDQTALAEQRQPSVRLVGRLLEQLESDTR